MGSPRSRRESRTGCSRASSAPSRSSSSGPKTVDLEVPAQAEIVLEGYVDPNERVVEGPFGDHTGYYSAPEEFPVFHVTHMTHRENPVYFSTVTGKPPTEDAVIGKAVERLFLPVVRLVLPEIVDMNLPVEGLFINVAIVSVRKSYPEHPRKVMHALWGLGQLMFTRYLIVVDADVDVHDLGEVLYRVGLQADPESDFEQRPGPVDQLSISNPCPRISGGRSGSMRRRKGRATAPRGRGRRRSGWTRTSSPGLTRSPSPTRCSPGSFATSPRT